MIDTEAQSYLDNVINHLPASTSVFDQNSFSNFTEIERYTTEEIWAVANNSDNEWEVVDNDHKIKICSHKRRSREVLPEWADKNLPRHLKNGFARIKTVETKNKLLGAVGAGEFGGGLYEIDKVSGNCELLSKGNFNEIVKTDSGIVTLSGLAHMSSDSGVAKSYKTDADGNLRLEKSINLGSEPNAFCWCGNEHILVVTHNSLILLQVDLKCAVKVMDTHLSGIYPNSITLFGKSNILIGCRHAVIKLIWENGNYKETWMIHADDVERKPPA